MGLQRPTQGDMEVFLVVDRLDVENDQETQCNLAWDIILPMEEKDKQNRMTQFTSQMVFCEALCLLKVGKETCYAEREISSAKWAWAT